MREIWAILKSFFYVENSKLYLVGILDLIKDFVAILSQGQKSFDLNCKKFTSFNGQEGNREIFHILLVQGFELEIG